MRSIRTQLLLAVCITGGLASAQPVITSIVDPYTGGTKLSPGGHAVITGTSLGLNPLVTVGGVNAFNLVPPQNTTQMTIQIPVNAALGASLPVVITTGAGASAPFNIALVQYAPVLISFTNGPLTSPRHGNGVAVTSTTPAAPGENITFYAIGLGPTNPVVNTGALGPPSPFALTTTTPTVTFGANSPVNVTARLANGQAFFGANYSGPLSGSSQAFIGVYQFVVTVPAGTATGSYPVSLTTGGATSNVLQLQVGPAPTAPVISAMVGESGKTALCPGDIAILSGLNLGANPTVTVGGKTAFTLNAPKSGNEMTIQIPVDAPLGAANVIVSPAAGQNSAPFSITLTQFAPVLSPGGNGSPNLAFHLSGGGSPVTNANPAIPGETLGLIAYGLGATNPVVPTGTVGPSNPAAVTVATPTVFVAGQAASNVSASLTNNQVGAYFISFAVPPNLTTGNYATALSIGGVTSGLVSVPVFVGPVISSVANAASNIAFNAPIAQGAIFVLKGTNLGPANIAISPTPFQSTSVSGTSVSVTISGTKVDALMYYTSAGQVAALLPSNTPVGTGTITVTNNGQVGVAAPITVVASNLGIFTIDSTGEGPGIVTYADYSLVSAAKADPCGGPNTSCGAANPGDTLILWATGLGPINGSDAKGDGLGVAQTSVPATLWLGGVQATIVYQGRSGCCVGEDQLVFTVPDTVPTGCAVPMVVQIGNQIGNSTVLPVAKGSRDCTPNSPAIAAVNVEQGVMAGPISVGIIELGKFGNGNGTGYEDEAGFQFLKIVSYAPGTQPFFASWIDDQPIGTCTVFSHLGGHLEPPLKDTDLAGIDAGPSFTVKGPDGSVAVKAGFVEFKGSLSPTGTFLVPGAFSVSGTGGADVGPFTANITVPPLATLSSPGNNAAVTRSSGMTITWTGGDPNGNLVIKVYGATDNSFNTGSRAECVVPAKPGTFTIPPYIMEALPAGNFAGFTIAPARTELPFKATGLSFGGIDINFDGTGFGYGAGTGSLTLK